MLLNDAEDLAKFVSELQRESDRGLPLVAGALIDELLQESLRAFFIASPTVDKLLDDASGPLATFSARSKTCFALGQGQRRETAHRGGQASTRKQRGVVASRSQYQSGIFCEAKSSCAAA
jgi:hypothetical protein